MKNLKFSRLFAAMMFVAVLVFVGCKPQTEEEVVEDSVGRPLTDDDAIVGTWAASATEQYVITKSDFTAVGTYSGNNIVIIEDSEDSGRLFVKYTKAIEYSNTEPAEDSENPWKYSSWTNNWYRYSTSAPDVGKWYAISYKDLTDTSVSIAGAAGEKTSFEKLSDAVKGFTGDEYFSWYSECVRQ